MQKTDILTTKANGRLCFLWGRSIQRTANLRSWEVSVMELIDRIALVLGILGGLNWGCVGIFGLDLVAALFGGSASVLSRVVYVLICLAALWSITLFFREDPVERRAKGNA